MTPPPPNVTGQSRAALNRAGVTLALVRWLLLGSHGGSWRGKPAGRAIFPTQAVLIILAACQGEDFDSLELAGTAQAVRHAAYHVLNDPTTESHYCAYLRSLVSSDERFVELFLDAQVHLALVKRLAHCPGPEQDLRDITTALDIILRKAGTETGALLELAQHQSRPASNLAAHLESCEGR